MVAVAGPASLADDEHAAQQRVAAVGDPGAAGGLGLQRRQHVGVDPLTGCQCGDAGG